MCRRHSLQTQVALGLAGLTAGVWWWGHDRSDEPGTRIEVEGVGDTAARPTAPDVGGRTLPHVNLLAADGGEVDLASLGGMPLVLNVWASTCAPCRAEMPALSAFADEFAGRLLVVGIDPLDNAAAMTRFADEVGVTYPLYRDPDGELMVEFGVTDLPTTLFVRADGTVAAVHLGALDEGELRALVRDELRVV